MTPSGPTRSPQVQGPPQESILNQSRLSCSQAEFRGSCSLGPLLLVLVVSVDSGPLQADLAMQAEATVCLLLSQSRGHTCPHVPGEMAFLSLCHDIPQAHLGSSFHKSPPDSPTTHLPSRLQSCHLCISWSLSDQLAFPSIQSRFLGLLRPCFVSIGHTQSAK